MAKRTFKVFGENVEGKSVFLPRFMRQQKPPDALLNLESTDKEHAIQVVARFVALIPFAEDNKTFKDLPDIFCTSQEFLDFGAGDYEEHAILLCNFFNYIDERLNEGKIKSYVVMGKAMPEGYTSYVMRRNTENNHVEIWNSITGEAYFFGRDYNKNKFLCIPLSTGVEIDCHSQDPICSLKEIGCVISEDNIYANVQKNSDPALISFNIDNPKQWKPFLTKKMRNRFFKDGIESV